MVSSPVEPVKPVSFSHVRCVSGWSAHAHPSQDASAAIKLELDRFLDVVGSIDMFRAVIVAKKSRRGI